MDLTAGLVSASFLTVASSKSCTTGGVGGAGGAGGWGAEASSPSFLYTASSPASSPRPKATASFLISTSCSPLLVGCGFGSSGSVRPSNSSSDRFKGTRFLRYGRLVMPPPKMTCLYLVPSGPSHSSSNVGEKYRYFLFLISLTASGVQSTSNCRPSSEPPLRRTSASFTQPAATPLKRM